MDDKELRKVIDRYKKMSIERLRERKNILLKHRRPTPSQKAELFFTEEALREMEAKGE